LSRRLQETLLKFDTNVRLYRRRDIGQLSRPFINFLKFKNTEFRAASLQPKIFTLKRQNKDRIIIIVYYPRLWCWPFVVAEAAVVAKRFTKLIFHPVSQKHHWNYMHYHSINNTPKAHTFTKTELWKKSIWWFIYALQNGLFVENSGISLDRVRRQGMWQLVVHVSSSYLLLINTFKTCTFSLTREQDAQGTYCALTVNEW